MQKQKVIRYILISVVVLGILLPHLTPAHAGFWDWLGSKVAGGAAQGMLYIVGLLTYAFLSLSALILYLAGALFDWTVSLAINGDTLRDISAVDAGWRAIRDVSNLFFIFILLAIAIATILQIETYGAKKLIAPLLIVALLINFSLVITKMIIDISNVFAWEFYDRITVGERKDDSDASIEVKNLSGVFITGLKAPSIEDFKLSDNTNADQYTDMLKAQVLAAILFLIIAFVLIAGAILFLIRIVVLLILMVLSPLGFILYILPATKQYAKKWWDTLFAQAFFAPAFLFMFYIVGKI